MSVCLSIYVFARLCVCLSAYIYVFARLCVCLTLCLCGTYLVSHTMVFMGWAVLWLGDKRGRAAQYGGWGGGNTLSRGCLVRIPDPLNSSLEFGLEFKGQGWRLLWSSTWKTPWLFLHIQSKFGVNFFKI